MVTVEWTPLAFAQLEALPAVLAFEVVRRVDTLAAFPEAGARVMSQDPSLLKCRQLIVKRTHRVVYEYDGSTGIVYVLAVQRCRQKLPTGRELKRRPLSPPDED